MRSVLRAMTSTRILSPDARSALLVAMGIALIVTPFMVGLGGAAVASGVFLGAIIVGLGFAGTAPTGRGTIPMSAHMVYDQGIAVGLLLAALIFGVVGEYGATAVFMFAGAVQLIVGTLTRYSAKPPTTA
jgi:hypothetical protein